MPHFMGSWISHQASEFLAAVSSYPTEDEALRGGIEHVAEAFEAEVVAAIRGSEVILATGLRDQDPAMDTLMAAVGSGESSVTLNPLGGCHVSVAELQDGLATHLVVARAGEEPFDLDEQVLLDNMGRTMGLVLRMLKTLDGERAALRHLEERQLLLERLARVQRSISHRAPLQEVLDAITEGVIGLTGDEIAALRLVDPDDPRYLLLASASGLDAAMHEKLRRTHVEQGAGGRAVKERRPYVMERYAEAPGAIPELSEDSLQAALAVPVFAEGTVVGSLVTATYRAGRVYTATEQEMLQALADNAAIALTDARTLESMREAQKAKDMLLAMVSHELKTPLTVIMGSLQTLRTRLSQLPEEMREELILSAVRRGEDLQRLIDMLLQSARADLAGVSQEVFLPNLIADAVRGFDATRDLRVAPAPDERLFVDGAAIRQILGLFLENGVAHSPEGTPIDVTSAVVSDRVSITVRNDGHIPEGLDVQTLFTPFQRGPHARSSGVGLGLYIAKSLADSVGGRIKVSSNGRTVEFTLVFPIDNGAHGASGSGHPYVGALRD